MAKVGYCSECGGSVRLCEDGSCVWGHAASCVTQVREVVDGPRPQSAPNGSESPSAPTHSSASAQAAAQEPRSTLPASSLGPVLPPMIPPTHHSSPARALVDASIIVRLVTMAVALIFVGGGIMTALNMQRNSMQRMIQVQNEAQSAAGANSSPSSEAQKDQCYANQGKIESAVYAYVADGHPVPLSFTSVRASISGRYLTTIPSCPSGGSYVWTATKYGGNLHCTKHGSPKDPSPQTEP